MTQHATLITPSKYAKLRNLARSTISREIRDKKIPVHGGLIDPIEADEARKRNLDMRRRPVTDAVAAEDLAAVTGSAYDLLIRARASRELTMARERQLDFRKRQGELLEADDVRRTWNETITMFESRMLQIPDAVAARVAAMIGVDDVLEVRSLIEKEIKSALRVLYEAGSGAEPTEER